MPESKKYHNPTFIVGTGRCGTKMLARILNAHSRICIPHELQLIFEYSGNGRRLYDFFLTGEAQGWRAPDFIKTVGDLSPHRFDKFFDFASFFGSRKYPVHDLGGLLTDLYFAVAASRGKDIFIEQTPWYGQRLDIMKELFPQAKFIHMVRDGRDVALSFARTPWWSDSPVDNIERWNSEVGKIAGDASRLLSDGQYLEIRYEDFVFDPQVHATRVLDFLGVKFEAGMLLPENMIDYSVYRKVDRSSHTSSEFNTWNAEKKSVVFADNVFGWKKLPPETFASMSVEARTTLHRFGYEV